MPSLRVSRQENNPRMCGVDRIGVLRHDISDRIIPVCTGWTHMTVPAFVDLRDNPRVRGVD